MKIPFNIPPYIEGEEHYIQQVIANRKICGDGEFTQRCSSWLEKMSGARKVLLTTSCTHALEMAAMLINIKNEDEVIMPSFTFVSTANAFVIRGARIKFVDIRADTMNIDEKLIEAAITERTKAIVPVHYAGVACDMNKIMEIANKYKLFVIEDAAQGVMSTYKERTLGSIGHFGCYSFHETKNYSMGEGGALLINDENYVERAEIIREKGTDRSKFFRGQVDKYTWMDIGSSYLPSELNAAYLWSQLEKAEDIYAHRLKIWSIYDTGLRKLHLESENMLPFIPDECKHNGHMYYFKTKNIKDRTNLINYLRESGISTVFHYIPLHSAPAGKNYGNFVGEDRYTTLESERLLRLPLHLEMTEDMANEVVEAIKDFYLG